MSTVKFLQFKPILYPAPKAPYVILAFLQLTICTIKQII